MFSSFLNRDNGLVIKFSMFGRLGYFRNGFKFAFDGFAVATFCFRGAVWFSYANFGIPGADLLLTSRWLQWLQGAVALDRDCVSNRVQPAARK